MRKGQVSLDFVAVFISSGNTVPFSSTRKGSMRRPRGPTAHDLRVYPLHCFTRVYAKGQVSFDFGILILKVNRTFVMKKSP